MKRLIINADDFGFTPDVNAGIVHCHRAGVLTSTTLMANGAAFEDAVRLAQETPTLDVGCHLALVQGRSLVTGKPLPEGPRELLRVLVRGQLDYRAELRAQIEKILAAGIRPTHFDSHKHTHIIPAVFREVAQLAGEFGVPYIRLPLDTTVRFARMPCVLVDRYYRALGHRYGISMPDHFIGYRLTGRLTEESLGRAIMNLRNGTTEFMCHPGFLEAGLRGAKTRLKESRLEELHALTSPRIRALIAEQNIVLQPFAVVNGPGNQAPLNPTY